MRRETTYLCAVVVEEGKVRGVGSPVVPVDVL